MKELFEMVELIAKRVKQSEESRLRLAKFLKKFDLTRRVEKDKLKKAKIAAVDGGLVHRSFHGFDMILTRACGVLYEYENGKLVGVDYYPNANPTPKPMIIFDSTSDMEFLWKASFERQASEVRLGIEVVEKWKPDLLLFDGSIVVSQFEVMNKNSLIYEDYRDLIKHYLTLLKVSGDTLIAGVIKDSRGTRFCDEVLRNFEIPKEFLPVLQITRDTNLLFYLLKTGERTKTFSYSSSPCTHPVLKDFGKFGKEIYGFYLRTAEFDRPIRVDFHSKEPEVDADRISSFLLAISQHPGYGIPSILIEADQRARIKDEMIDFVYQDIVSKAGNIPSLFKLRGKERPF